MSELLVLCSAPHREYYDISVAVSTPKGLVVPVLRDVDQMSFADVEMVSFAATSWAIGANLCAAGRCVADGSREAMAALGPFRRHPVSHYLLLH